MRGRTKEGRVDRKSWRGKDDEEKEREIVREFVREREREREGERERERERERDKQSKEEKDKECHGVYSKIAGSIRPKTHLIIRP
jgi:hypothetical protein